jgi:prepilin-type N-terminal cleavage/methylation domain-containing protein
MKGYASTGTVARPGTQGFTLIEMLVSMGIFLVICGSAFTLLGISQQRYASESQVVNSFQEARLGLDQIVRDVSDAGYPPLNQFENTAVLGPQDYAVTPVAWFPGYPNNPCLMSSGLCTTPERWGMFIETNPSQAVHGMQYIRYKLNGTTLYRGVIPKTGLDPFSTINDNQLVPFVQNVMNNATPAQIAQIQTAYPGMFPGGLPVPVFQYWCAPPGGGSPVDCTSPGAGLNGTPTSILSVTITLIVMTPTPDAQTGLVHVVELTGRGTVMNSFP